MEAIYSNILEINPQQLFSIMKEDIYKDYPIITLLNINKDYIEIRPQLIKLMHKISKKMGFKSQTFFLSIYYLDIILMGKKASIINNFYLLSLSCFIVASKYCENDPIVPPLENYLKLYNKYSSNLNINCKLKLEDLFEMEVQILKYLNYNLHYVTIYDFDLFFFNHGIIKKQQIKDIINNNVIINSSNKNNKSDLSCSEDDDDITLDSAYIKKILEKIYKKSRFYLDLIINKEKICFKYNVLLLSIYIMKKSVEEIILNEYKLKNKDYYLNKRQIIKKTNLYFKEVMNNFYNIDYEKEQKYQELIKDKEIKNIFPHQEKIHEFKSKKLKNTTNLTNLDKICINKKNEKDAKIKKKFIKKKNLAINSMSNLTVPQTFKENQSSAINLNSFEQKGNIIITGNNSNEKYPIENINSNGKRLLEEYKNNNKIFYSKTLGNKKFVKNKTSVNKNNSHIDVMNNNSNSLEKNIVNCTFTQLKNNLKKNFSLNKKRCKDKYTHANNIKSLWKLSSCSDTIKNIKEGAFINNNNNVMDKMRSKSPGQQLFIDMNNSPINIGVKNNNHNRAKILTYSKYDKPSDSKEKIRQFYNSLNTNINYNENGDDDIINDINNQNNNDNKDESIHSSKSKKVKKIEKHKNLISIKYRTNVHNDNNDINSIRSKPYFKKVIHNFEPMRKKVIKKDNLKIYINNSINKTNYNPNTINNTTLNKNINYISLTSKDNNNEYENENKIDIIKKRIICINKKSHLGNSIIYRSNNNLDATIIKDINNNEKKNSKSKLLYTDNESNTLLIKKAESNNINQNKISKIPKSLKKISPTNPTNIIYQNKPNNIIINFRYTINQSPIAYIKEIKEINLNNNNNDNNKDNNKQNNNNYTSNKDLVLSLKNISSTIENNCSYHRKKVFNSLNKKKRTMKMINKYIKNNTINDVRNKNDLQMCELMKSEGNSFFKKYKNDLLINIENSNSNIFTKKRVNNRLNSFNTIDSTKNFNENTKTIENEPIKDNIQKLSNNISDEIKTHQKIYSIMTNHS